MTSPSSPSATPEPGAISRLHLARWTCRSGSNAQSRGAVVIESGRHRWQASADGNGPVAALFRAVDDALLDVLAGHPRLLSYDVHAVREGVDSEGAVTVNIAPPGTGEGSRSEGLYEGRAQGANIIAASVEAYIEAINRLLAEEHWHGAIEAAGNERAAPVEQHPETEVDREVRPDTSRWWNE